MFKLIKYGLSIFLLFVVSCIDPFEPEGLEFESALVIEATLTDENKIQTIMLNRTFEFGTDGPQAETNANVVVIDDSQNQIMFDETEPGLYTSITAFAAQPNRAYTLQIQTSDGREYLSSATQLTQATEIDELFAERIVSDDGTDGIAIMVNSFDTTGNSRNYRYEYEETYRVEAPDWRPDDLFLLQGPGITPCQVEVRPRERDEQICFPTTLSNTIIQTETNSLDEDRVSNFVVRFINRNNFIISFRYSILVRQMVQSGAAFEFFETLNEFSGSGSLFSQIQPGLLVGNVFSANDDEEIVLGFFDIATVSEQRIFFNYGDFYPGEALPPYVDPCMRSAPILSNMGGCVLSSIVETNTLRYLEENTSGARTEGPFTIVPRVCGDCTVLGPTQAPDFWVE